LRTTNTKLVSEDVVPAGYI